ncbi:NAD(P)H-binding protein [Mycobacterium sp. ACS4331]|uniref:NAD(P)H-binding protein n=1 Tax=Mycobacterium sp. ACS4331 TaxID=1834121 RepID=UPI0008018B49|nr:NAD(P)H-binding protein [Mycobacterium sp. ACS4331]OBF30111.1 NAD-dependent epimerase [Mycobacterium sp. ACS4331]
MKSMRILVTGASGYVGSRLVTALLDAGHEVTVAGRDPAKFGAYGWIDRVTAVLLDAADADGTAAAVAAAGPVDVLYYLLHGIGEPGFRDADNAAATHVAQAAKAAGVKRIVYLGGFVPDDDSLSEHLASRAEVADALHVDGGPEVVWLGAAMIIGAGSTSFEMLRYTGDRFVLMPMPKWARHPMDPISIRDVLHYLLASADPDQVPPGSYDICGPATTTYGDLMRTYARLAGNRRARIDVGGIDTAALSWLTAVGLPIPGGLAADLVASLDYPMTASAHRLSDIVPDPDGGLVGIEDAISRSLEPVEPKPVDQLSDPHHLADTDAEWAGGDALRIQRLAAMVTPAFAHPALGLISAVPKPVAGAVRASLDALDAISGKLGKPGPL